MLKSKLCRRIFASALCLVLCGSMVPSTAFAVETESNPYGIEFLDECSGTVMEVTSDAEILKPVKEDAKDRNYGIESAVFSGNVLKPNYGGLFSPFQVTSEEPIIKLSMNVPTSNNNIVSGLLQSLDTNGVFGTPYLLMAVTDLDTEGAICSRTYYYPVTVSEQKVITEIPMNSGKTVCALVLCINNTGTKEWLNESELTFPDEFIENAKDVVSYQWEFSIDPKVVNISVTGGGYLFDPNLLEAEIVFNVGDAVFDATSVKIQSDIFSYNQLEEKENGEWILHLNVSDKIKELAETDSVKFSFDITASAADPVLICSQFAMRGYTDEDLQNQETPSISFTAAAPLQSCKIPPAVTITPADLTIYQGGDGGYDAVVGEGSTVGTTSNSLPHPLFKITAPSGTNIDPTELTFTTGEDENAKSWTVVSDGNGYYHFAEGDGQTPVRVTYTDSEGTVTSDEFEVSEVKDTYAEFTIDLYPGENDFSKITASTGNDTTSYPISVNSGTLTVRAVADKDDPTSDVKDAVPTEKVPAGTAQAVEPADTTYTLNNTGVQLPVDSKPSLLFDDIIEDSAESTERTNALKEAADKALGEASGTRNYEIKYLDLVDANNGNAWITSSAGTDIYWGYPDGTNQETEFTLLHFKGLHRDDSNNGNSGFDVSDINSAIVETVTDVEKMDNGIKFHVEAGGFSPFALVWDVAPTTYTIKASAGSGGTITPSGNVIVAEGEDQSFTITASDGYKIADVKVDGTSVGAVDSYTFEDVKANHSIEATFTKEGGIVPPITYYTITASAGEGGAINPSGTIRVPAGGDRTFTISAAEGYEIADVLVDGKSVGAVDSYTFENVRASHTISVVFQEASGIADPDDTGVSDWLDTDNHKVYLNGYPDDSFQPEKDMTRAEAAQMFYNLLRDQDVETTVSFTDVAADAWYATAVNALASLEIVNGVGDDRFSPERTITRAEFTTMAMRFCDEIPDGENIFSDVDQEDWFYEYVVGSIQYGWINGYPDGTFRPNDTISRAEVTTITNRMLGRAADEAFVDQHQDSLRIFTDLKDTHWAYYQIVEATNAHEYTKDNGTEDWTKLV